jgi:hypothetical protein
MPYKNYAYTLSQLLVLHVYVSLLKILVLVLFAPTDQ